MQSNRDGYLCMTTKKNRNTKFRIPYLIQIILVGILPFIFLSVFILIVNFSIIPNLMLELVRQRSTSLVRIAATEIQAEIQLDTQILFYAAEMLNAANDSQTDQQKILENNFELRARFPGGATLLDENGVAVASTPEHKEREGIDYSFREYFQQAQKERKVIFSPVLKEKPSGKSAVVISQPLPAPSREILIAVFFLQDSPWKDKLEKLHTIPESNVIMTDRFGEIIFQSEPDLSKLEPDVSQEFREIIKTNQPESHYIFISDIQSEVIISHAPIEEIGWVLFLEEDWRQIIQPIRDYLPWLIIILISGALVMTLLVTFTISRLTSPLNLLLKSAQRTAAGEPFLEIEERGPAEIKLFIQNYNNLVSTLEKREKEIHVYASNILESQEEERKRISRELHDQTVQDLIALSQRIELCLSEIQNDPTAARKRLNELHKLVDHTITDVRRMSNDLRPSILEDLGLSAAIRMLCDHTADKMVEATVEFFIRGKNRRLYPDQELSVFRITQEALTNIIKHARQARKIQVILEFSDYETICSIEDDGPGFIIKQSDKWMQDGHLGLAGMEERARLSGGKIEIESKPGCGSKIRLIIPNSLNI